MGNVGVPSKDMLNHWAKRIRDEFRMAACRYVTFRAMFGGWATGAMLYGSTRKALEKRMATLGGTLKARAPELSLALMPPTGVK